MPADLGHIKEVVALSDDLVEAGFQPVLVGGMALVILGSQRITKDFDLVVSRPVPTVKGLVAIMYRHHLELITKYDSQGEPLRSVDNPTVASIKFDSEGLKSAAFFNWETRLRIDLLLDFPLPARDLAGSAAKVSFPSGYILVATPPDLLRLKEIAHSDRKKPTDAQDLEFLRNYLKSK